MTIPVSSARLLTATLLVISGTAGAWTPYEGAPPYGYSPEQAQNETAGSQAPMQGYGAPQLPPYAMPPMGPYDFPGMPGAQPVPEGAEGAQTYPVPPDNGQSPPNGGLGLKQEMTDEAYILVIELNGQDPSEVDVSARGNLLLVTSRSTAETRSSQSFDDGRGYQRSWSWSSGQRSRRLPVPPDADLGMMRREQDDEQIRITIPRRQAQGDSMQRQ
jgi:HSP20 family molecular chaperone IbpA